MIVESCGGRAEFESFVKILNTNSVKVKDQIMARIAGVMLPNEKQIRFALTAIFGIGQSQATNLCRLADVAGGKKVKALSAEETARIREAVDKNCRIEGELRRDVSANIKRLKEIGCYRGIRHSKRLPVHGQRTKTNSRTVRGNVRRTMGSGRRILTKT